MIDSDGRRVDELSLNLIAEFQALAVAFKRLGERMSASSASHEETALMLLNFFQEQQIAMTTHEIYLESIRELEKSVKSPAKQIKHVHSLCAEKLFKRYGMTF